MNEKEKPEILMHCTYCLKKMSNGSNPKVYTHEVESNDCPVKCVQLNKNLEIARIFYIDGTIIEP